MFKDDHDLIHKGVLEITPKIGCSNMCEYCPQVLLINRYKNIRKNKVTKDERFMSVDNFKNYISTIPQSIDFHFTGYVEPFDNPDCDKLILISDEKGHRVHINTTLEGLTKEKYDNIKNINFKGFRIHLPSSSYDELIGIKIPKVKRPSGQFELRDDWVDMLKYVVRNQSNKLKLHAHGGCNEHALEVLKELEEEGSLSKENMGPLFGTTSTRSQNKDSVVIDKKVKIPPQYNIRGKCKRVFQSVLLPDGRLGLCCQDYGLEHVVGNLSTQTWAEYRTSDYFKKIAIEGEDLCDYCDIGYTQNTYENIEKIRGS